MEERPHRFDRLRERNPKEWEFYMYRCCTDPETGENSAGEESWTILECRGKMYRRYR